MMLTQPVTNETIDHAVDLALAGDVRPWPFPDEYLPIFDKFAANPDPAQAEEVKRLGHEALASREKNRARIKAEIESQSHLGVDGGVAQPG